tara:strand:- start:277 stop:930 length:654 start_codon:yes stop_codon:yes gene_type:complete
MITYGNGEVLFDGKAQGFELRYSGIIKITKNSDNLFLRANRNKIIGFTLDGTDIPSELFNYNGNLKISLFLAVEDLKYVNHRVSVQGLDYWDYDKENWEDDNSQWGSRNNQYLSGAPQNYDKHNIVVNNNIRVTSNTQYKYEDGKPVSSGTLIHIHNDGIAMTGGVHTKNSVIIYPQRETIKPTTQPIQQSVQSTTVSTTTYSGSGSSGGSSGGGGY